MKHQLATAVCIVAFQAAIGAQTPSVKEIEAVEHDRVAAVERRDADAVAKFLADDFTSTGGRGQIATRQQYLESLRRNQTPVRMTHDQVQIRIYGETAVITGRSTVTRPDGSRVGTTRYTHVYVRQAGAWKLVAMHNSTIPE